MKSSQKYDNLSIQIISNTGKQKELVQLLGFRNLIYTQLFSMNKVIVTKTIFNRIHKSMLLKDQTGKIIGGLCFYEIELHHCVSIIYFAVSSKFQVKGYGSYLMNHFKQQMRKRGHKILATQADAISLNFYYKNGFLQFEKKVKKIQRQPLQKQIKQNEQEQDYNKNYKKYQPWLEYIQNYYASLLMVYKIPPQIDFFHSRQIVARQKQGLIQRLNSRSYRKYTFKKQQMLQLITEHHKKYQDKHCMVLTSQKTQQIQKQLEKQQKQLLSCHKTISKMQQLALLKIIKNHECSWILRMNFIKIPDSFHNILSDFLTLPSIEEKIVNNVYSSSQQMCAQLNNLFENLRLFLINGSNYYEACLTLQTFLKPYMCSICQGTFDPLEYLNKQTSKISQN